MSVEIRNILISETLPCRESVHLRTNELECKGKIHLFQLPSLGQDPNRTSTIFLLSERARSPGEVREVAWRGEGAALPSLTEADAGEAGWMHLL